MDNFVLYISSLLITLVYFVYILIILLNNKIEGTNGFDIASDILCEYDGIKIILNSSFFTYYDVKRKIIKMSKKCYYGNSSMNLMISLMEVGVFIFDKMGSKVVDIFRKVIPTLKILYILPVIAVIINFSTYSVISSRIGLILLFIFFIINYFLLTIKNNIYNFVLEKDFDLKNKILKYIDLLIKLDYVILCGYVLMMFRFFLILINIL